MHVAASGWCLLRLAPRFNQETFSLWGPVCSLVRLCRLAALEQPHLRRAIRNAAKHPMDSLLARGKLPKQQLGRGVRERHSSHSSAPALPSTLGTQRHTGPGLVSPQHARYLKFWWELQQGIISFKHSCEYILLIPVICWAPHCLLCDKLDFGQGQLLNLDYVFFPLSQKTLICTSSLPCFLSHLWHSTTVPIEKSVM